MRRCTIERFADRAIIDYAAEALANRTAIGCQDSG
jgi:hypothetical protein